MNPSRLLFACAAATVSAIGVAGFADVGPDDPSGDAQGRQVAVQPRVMGRICVCRREDRIADLVFTARRLVAERHYAEASGVVDQILLLAPKNDYALGVRPLLAELLNAPLDATTRPATIPATRPASTRSAQTRASQSRPADTRTVAERVAELIARTRRLTSESKYKEAIAIIDQILEIDPRNDYALGVRGLLEDRDRGGFFVQRKYRDSSPDSRPARD